MIIDKQVDFMWNDPFRNSDGDVYGRGCSVWKCTGNLLCQVWKYVNEAEMLSRNGMPIESGVQVTVVLSVF